MSEGWVEVCGLLSQLPVTSLFHLVCPRSGDDNEAYQLFRFRVDELETIVDKVCLPDVVKANGSKHSKLEAVLNMQYQSHIGHFV